MVNNEQITEQNYKIGLTVRLKDDETTNYGDNSIYFKNKPSFIESNHSVAGACNIQLIDSDRPALAVYIKDLVYIEIINTKKIIEQLDKLAIKYGR